MQVEWFGQSAFKIEGDDATVVIDPFGDMSPAAGRGITWDYPRIEGVRADVLLITHEHLDHNAAEVIEGEPATLRSTAGRLESPIGEVLAVSSEHDEAAGTERGPNSIFVFELDGMRIAHFGDFGQRELRDEQAAAIGTVDILFVPSVEAPRSAGAGCRHRAETRRPLGDPDALPDRAHQLPGAGRRVPRTDRRHPPCRDARRRHG